jgi:hypothetical protein
MSAIHFVERIGNTWKVKGASHPHEYESGYWVVADETARRLVGGDLYLHDGQNDPSRFGGVIVGYRIEPAGELAGRVIFRFQATAAHRGLKTPRQGWGNEKKIVW